MPFWLWIGLGAIAFLGGLELLNRYTKKPLRHKPVCTKLSPLDRFFVSDEDWEGPPML